MGDDKIKEKPRGELALRTLCMPADTNPGGDIFGGWLLAQMDIAGSLVAKRVAQERTVTIAIDAMEFLLPVFVGDMLECYVEVEKIGRTSIRLHVEAWVQREFGQRHIRVTEGTVTFVAIDENRKPRPVKRDDAKDD